MIPAGGGDRRDRSSVDGVVVAVARLLNRGGVSAAPVPKVEGALSIFDDEWYENYDYDLIPPRQRLKIGRVLEAGGFRWLRGTVLTRGRLVVRFPRPPRSLSSDPLFEVRDALASSTEVLLLTPTQAVLAILEISGGVAQPQGLKELRRDLEALVHEQPANLDKVRDWTRRTERAGLFERLRPALAAAQEHGFELRRSHRFRSTLPR